jgi:hypothetical protein
MPTTVFSRDTWMPSVIEEDGVLLLEVVGGADALHDPRVFTVPLREEHLRVLRDSLRRHVLLQGALLPLCYAAGIRGDWDEEAAASLLDPVLLGTPQEVDDALRGVRVDRRTLIAHRASIPLLDRRRYYEAAQSATETTDWARVRKHEGP